MVTILALFTTKIYLKLSSKKDPWKYQCQGAPEVLGDEKMDLGWPRKFWEMRKWNEGYLGVRLGQISYILKCLHRPYFSGKQSSNVYWGYWNWYYKVVSTDFVKCKWKYENKMQTIERNFRTVKLIEIN